LQVAQFLAEVDAADEDLGDVVVDAFDGAGVAEGGDDAGAYPDLLGCLWLG